MTQAPVSAKRLTVSRAPRYGSARGHMGRRAVTLRPSLAAVAVLAVATVAAVAMLAPRSAAAIAFGDPVVVNSLASSDAFREDGHPRVATDGDGTWIALWDSANEGDPVFGSDPDLFFARSLDGGASWSVQSPLHADATADRRADQRPAIAVWGDTAVAVWQADGVLGAGDTTDLDVLYAVSTDAGASWSAPRQLDASAAETRDEAPEIATDGSVWVVVWHRDDQRIMMSRATNPDGGWSAPVALAPPPANQAAARFPHLATDGGMWVIAWDTGVVEQRDLVYVVSGDDLVTWSPAPLPLTVPEDSRDDFEVRLATDGGGSWIAVWESQVGQGEIWFARSTSPDTGWSVPGPLVADEDLRAGDNERPQVVAAERAAWLVVWQRFPPGGNDYELKHSLSTDDGASWSDPVVLADDDGGDDDSPGLATDALGRFVTVFRSDSTRGGTSRGDGDILAEVAAATCGDAVEEPGEPCDLGAANGAPAVCCTAICRLRPAGETCRAAGGPCDAAETCTGTTSACPGDGLAPAGTPCRAAAGACDVAEACDGQGQGCPADGFVAAGTVCRPAASGCDLAEACSGQAPGCPADTFTADATVCDSGDACIDDSCQAGVCTNPPGCEAIDIGGTPLDETLDGRKKPTVITVALRGEQNGAVEAAGYAEDTTGLTGAAAAGAPSARRAPLAPGVKVTKLVRRKLKVRSGSRTVLRLRLNRAGLTRQRQAGTLQVRVLVRVTPRGGVPSTLLFRRLWQR